MSDKPLRALRRFCLDCQGGHAPSVAACRDGDYLLTSCAARGVGRRRPERAREGPEEAVQGRFLQDLPPVGHDLPVTKAEQDALRDNPLRVIRRFCLICGGSRAEVRTCDARDACLLWSYRFGILPSTFKRVLARQRRSRTELLLPGLLQ